MALVFEIFSYGRSCLFPQHGHTMADDVLATQKHGEYYHGHYNDVIMGAMASRITSPTIVYSNVYSDADQRKHQSSTSLALCGEFTVTGKFPAQMASNAENVSIWWRHHGPDLVFPECFGLGTERVKLTSVFIAIPTSLQTANGSYTLKLLVFRFNFMISNWHRVGSHSYSTCIIYLMFVEILLCACNAV